MDNQVQTTAPSDGTSVDLPAARDLVVAEWLTAPRPVELPTEVVTPDIGQAEVDRAVREEARPLASAPVTVDVAGQIAELPVSVLTDAASLVPGDGGLVLHMDGAMLVDAVMARTTDLLTPAADATFAFKDDKPVVVPGTPGTTLDPEALAGAVATAATSPVRTAKVELVPTEPQESEATLEALGIKEIISEFDTPLTSDHIRTINIANGASKLNGMLIRPGETFSLADALSPIDGAHGYVLAGAIVNGEHSEAWGGGLSQVSTTTYNAAYFAGMEIVEHKPHSEYFARYPAGREATIYIPTIDMKWRNNTPYGALIQAWVDPKANNVHVRIWGTKYWTVESTTSGRWNVHSPTTVYSQSPTCTPQRQGNPGFTVKVTRKVLLDGTVKSERELDGHLQGAEQGRVRPRPLVRLSVSSQPPGAHNPEAQWSERATRGGVSWRVLSTVRARCQGRRGPSRGGGTTLPIAISAAGTVTSPRRPRTTTCSASRSSRIPTVSL